MRACAWILTSVAVFSAYAADPVAVLDETWSTLETELYDQARAQRELTDAAYDRLRTAAVEADDLYAFAPSIQAFMAGLGVSHTRFIHDGELDYYFFKSLFGSRDPDAPAVHHIGASSGMLTGVARTRVIFMLHPL